MEAALLFHGLDVLAWVRGGAQPPAAYLASAPVSYPLIGLCQVAR